MGKQETVVEPAASVFFFFFFHIKALQKKKAGSSKNGEGQTLGKLNSLGELSCTSFAGVNLAYNASNFTVLCVI